jgi:hypothetical protein
MGYYCQMCMRPAWNNAVTIDSAIVHEACAAEYREAVKENQESR